MTSIIIGAAAIVTILLVCVLYTARASFLYATIAVVLIAAMLVFVERAIVTPREEVQQTVRAIADALESNRPEAVLQFVSSAAPDIRQQGAAALRDVYIDQVKIKPNLTVQLDEGKPPTKATATFNVVVIGGNRTQTIAHQRGAWFFTVDFVKEGTDWRVVDYKQQDPRQGS